jgi:imidazolonepropionase-like amidohydrolase
MAERGTRAVPTISAGTRSEIEFGIDIYALQPNPGAMRRPETEANALRLMDSGVTIIPGTDVGVNMTDYGEEMLIELEAYVRLGLDPGLVIGMATARAARHLGIESETGTLAPGMVADVLVVEGEPDRDIAALRQPRLVLRAGVPIQPTRPRPAPVPGGAW